MNFQTAKKKKVSKPITEAQNSPKGYGSSVICDVKPGV